jgi:hypothetical protein
LGQLGGLFAQHTLAYKIIAIAQAIIDTYRAANVALASAPPPWNFIAMATVIATGLKNVAQISGVEVNKPKGGFQKGGRLTKGKAGIFEGTGNEIVAPESDFKTYSAELVRHALIDSRNYISVSSGAGSNNELIAIKQELISLKQAIIDRPARAYLDDREAKKIVSRGGAMNRRSKI